MQFFEKKAHANHQMIKSKEKVKKRLTLYKDQFSN